LPATLTPRHAAILGLAQGPAELLPVSSSAHTAAIPLLAGWRHGELDAELRKSLEVAVHAGAGLALALAMRAELAAEARALDRSRAVVLALSLLPVAIAGVAFERPIERRLGGPRTIAAGLCCGAVAMALADARPERRRRRDAGPVDGLALGLAQAAALIPGVSRNGAALTAARARGFARADAEQLSWHAALPVILGASALKGLRLGRRGASGEEAAALLMGAASAFGSTLASTRLLRRTGRRLLPYSVYRVALAALLVRRARARRTPS
jgi:undecaprenyl-diphosphatase